MERFPDALHLLGRDAIPASATTPSAPSRTPTARS